MKYRPHTPINNIISNILIEYSVKLNISIKIYIEMINVNIFNV